MVGEISYDAAAAAVRADLVAAHERAWHGLAGAGDWWTGAERVAIAGEVRAAWGCALCRERKAALSPAAVAGAHEAMPALPAVAIDAIHRITTDPGRLTRAWFDGLLAGGLTDAAYVELLGVVVTVIGVDGFCRGVGAPLHLLPPPRPGAPRRYRPAATRPEGAWVDTIPGDAARGAEADLYPRRPVPVPNVLRALSLVPDAVRTLADLGAAHYLTPAQMMDLTRGRAIDRAQMELVAGRVSARRECFY